MYEIAGKQKEPMVMMIYGSPGIGKTTFASQAPNPVFIGDELNKEFDFPKIIVANFNEVIKALELVEKGKKYQDRKTIVIDSISSLEDMLRHEIIKADPRGKEFASINQVHGGYGRGVDRMVFRTQALINKLKYMVEIGYNVIITCHSIKDTEEDATLLRTNVFYRPSLERKTLRIWEKWLPTILFARDKIILDSESDKTKSLADQRVLYTQYRASHYAKNRYGLPFEVPLKGGVVKSLIKAKDKFYNKSPDGVDSTTSIMEARGAGATPAKGTKPDLAIEELKAIYERIPENKRPKVDWSLINSSNFKKSKDKLMELTK